MKKQIKDFVALHGCTAHYSGKVKTMFIHGESAETVEELLFEKYAYSLPFALSTKG